MLKLHSDWKEIIVLTLPSGETIKIKLDKKASVYIEAPKEIKVDRELNETDERFVNLQKLIDRKNQEKKDMWALRCKN